MVLQPYTFDQEESEKRKKDKSPQREVEQEDDTLKAHCIVVEKECKKDGAKDYNKIFRSLSATREHQQE